MIVSNATPLIAFARINRLDILNHVIGTLVIPEAVSQEIVDHTADKPGVIHLTTIDWITVYSVASFQQVQLLLPTLDQGEAEVIALALEQQAHLVLMDELTGRKVARSLGLSVTGSVGILMQAKQQGLIKAIKPYLEAMRQQGVHYSQRFINQILLTAGEA